MAEIIQLRRLRVVRTAALAARFLPCDKVPALRDELRPFISPSRVAERSRDAVGDLGRFKPNLVRRRFGKMRLFRVWKLLPLADSVPVVCRPLHSRVRDQGRLLRL